MMTGGMFGRKRCWLLRLYDYVSNLCFNLGFWIWFYVWFIPREGLIDLVQRIRNERQ